MRKLLILFCFLVFNANAQTSIYHPFPDSSAVWHQERSVFHGLNDYYNYEEEFTLNGDTIIGLYTYKKLYLIGASENSTLGLIFCHPSHPPILDTVPYYWGGIRQEISNKRVYFLQRFPSTEYLLYDFNLSLNDTLPETFTNGGAFTVQSIDSIFDGSGWRKQFYYAGTGSGYPSLIEGIGSSRGLLTNINPYGPMRAELHCFQENGITLYQDTCPIGCDFINTKIQIVSRMGAMQVYPNPFIFSTTISLSPSFTESELRIFDSFGRMVRVEKVNGRTLNVDRVDLANGIYLFQLSNGDGLTLSSKVVVE